MTPEADSQRDFTWVDGERLVRFGGGAAAEAPDLLAARGFAVYTLVTTERAEATAPQLASGAGAIVHVPSGPVPEAAAAVRAAAPAESLPLVALGGGRVVDSTKAVAGADGLACAAVPTTLSGAPLTPFHRLPEGAGGASLVRPALIVADPELMASQAMPQLAASAMNALAHAVESLYGPLANPVAEGAALRAAALLVSGLDADPPARDELALGAVLAGYAVGTTGFALHHATCQTIVRSAGTPHAETNAVMLPHSVAFMKQRAAGPLGRLAGALEGRAAGDPAAAEARIAAVAALAGPRRLSELGVDAAALPGLAAAILDHPALANTPPAPPDEGEVRALLETAL